MPRFEVEMSPQRGYEGYRNINSTPVTILMPNCPLIYILFRWSHKKYYMQYYREDMFLWYCKLICILSAYYQWEQRERESYRLNGKSNESASGISVLSYQCHKHSTADHIFNVGITLCILTTSKVPYYLQCIHLLISLLPQYCRQRSGGNGVSNMFILSAHIAVYLCVQYLIASCYICRFITWSQFKQYLFISY